MAISDEIKALLVSNGATLVGYADLRGIALYSREHLPFGISIAVALNPRIVSHITEGPTREYNEEYESVNQLLDKLGHETVNFLKERGYAAEFTAASGAYDPDTLTTPFPHKTVATRAGIGWIGKCALLITGTFGSAVRITSVLSNVELATSDPIDVSHCGHCINCVEVCRVHAPSGQNWHVGIYRDSFFDAHACQRNARELTLAQIGIHKYLCGMCIPVCPWTQKYIER